MGSGVDSMTPEERLKILPPPGITPQLLPQLQKHLSPEQMRLMALSPPQVGNIFPNLAVLFLYAPGRDYTFVGALAVHTFVPRGPEKFEFYTWFFAERNVPEEKNGPLRPPGTYNAGPPGTTEQDTEEEPV